jgi:hypothetical protein
MKPLMMSELNKLIACTDLENSRSFIRIRKFGNRATAALYGTNPNNDDVVLIKALQVTQSNCFYFHLRQLFVFLN